MRNSNTHSLTIKRNLKKCKSIFNAYNELQYAYGLKLENNHSFEKRLTLTVKSFFCSQRREKLSSLL